MKYIKKLLIIVLAIVSVGATTYYVFLNKTDEEKIEERLNTFVNSYSIGDLNGCISCFDAKGRNAYKGIGNLGSLIGGKIGVFGFNLGGDNISSLFSLGVATQDVKIELKIKSIDIESENTADVMTYVTYSDKWIEHSEELPLKMVKENVAWYNFWSNNWYIIKDSSFL